MSNIYVNALAPVRNSLSADVDIRPVDTDEAAPVLLATDQVSLLATVQDDLATVLSSMRRHVGRRADILDNGQPRELDEAPLPSREARVKRLKALLVTTRRMGPATFTQVRSVFPDPSELIIALAALRESDELDESLREDIETITSALIQEYGESSLVAGVNISGLATAFARRTGLSANSLRQAYRTLIGASACEGLTYRYLIDVFGFSERGRALEFLEQALAADMAAQTPSHSQAEFQPILELLFQLRLLRSADSMLVAAAHPQADGVQAPARRASADQIHRDAVDFLIASLTDLGEAGRKFDIFVRRWRVCCGDGEFAHWVRRILQAMAALPCELFPDLAYRRALLETLHAQTSRLLNQYSVLPPSGWSTSTRGKYV